MRLAAQPQAEPETEIAEINAAEINADEISSAEIGSAPKLSAAEPADFEVEIEAQPASEFATSPDLVAYHQERAHGEIHREAPVESVPELRTGAMPHLLPAAS